MPDVTASLALLLAAGAVTVAPLRGPARSTRPRASTAPTGGRARAVVAATGVCAVALLLELPPWVMVVLAPGAGAAVLWAARRVAPLGIEERRAVATTLETIAACLDAGLPVEAAMPASAPSGELNNRVHQSMMRTSALLRLGADAAVAWQPVADQPPMAGFAHAACRSADGGLRLASAARETAAELRRSCRAQATARAARAGVMMTAPLALCFLPAFICLGLAPTVIGLIGSLALW